MTKRQRYAYMGYLQIAEIDALDETAPRVTRTYLWDPSEPVATRILSMCLYHADGSWKDTLYYTHDLQKNVTALFGGQVNRRAKYQYDAYGNLTLMEGDAAEENPYRYSSEYHDADLGLIYYNYRHYNPTDGRWITRDPINERGGENLYAFVYNMVVGFCDLRGLDVVVLPPSMANDMAQYATATGQIPDMSKCQDLECYKDGIIYQKEKDDAGRECCSFDMATVVIHVESTVIDVSNQRNVSSGHVFLETPHMIRGLYPPIDSIWGIGVIRPDDDHEEDAKFKISFKACPQSISLLEYNITESEKNPPYYDLLSMFGINCCGWACKMLQDSGFTPPFSPSKLFFLPSEFIYWHMQQIANKPQQYPWFGTPTPSSELFYMR